MLWQNLNWSPMLWNKLASRASFSTIGIVTRKMSRAAKSWHILGTTNSRDVRPRGLASASRPKNLASASASASWVVASASASWGLASASWVLASSLEASRGLQPKRNGM